MATRGRKKSHVNRALTRSHLHAIGLVAAHWNSLEVMVLVVISKIANIPFPDTVAMVTPSNFSAWLDILRRLVRKSNEHDWKEHDLVKVCEKLKVRQAERNAVVHAFWGEPSNTGLGSLLKQASGIGMPKRGAKIFLEITKTAKEMREVAKRIEEAEQEFVEWWAKQPPAQPIGMLSQFLKAMPNPHQTTTKQRTQP